MIKGFISALGWALRCLHDNSRWTCFWISLLKYSLFMSQTFHVSLSLALKVTFNMWENLWKTILFFFFFFVLFFWGVLCFFFCFFKNYKTLEWKTIQTTMTWDIFPLPIDAVLWRNQYWLSGPDVQCGVWHRLSQPVGAFAKLLTVLHCLL